MKKAVLISTLLVIVLLSIAFFMISRLKSSNLDSETESMMKRAGSLSHSIETSFSSFIDETDYKFTSNDYTELLVSEDRNSVLYRNLKKFVFKHQDLIEEISVSNETNSRKITLPGRNQLELQDIKETTQSLEQRKNLTFTNDKAIYTYPLLDRDKRVYANLKFVLNIQNLVHSIIEQDNVDKSTWIFLARNDKILLTQTYNPDYSDSDAITIDKLDYIQTEINRGLSGNEQSKLIYGHKSINMIFAYSPVSLMNQDYLIIYGKNKADLFVMINYVTITLSIIFAIILFIAIWTFMYFISKLKKSEERLLRIQTAVNNASDLIIITDMNRKTLFVNQTYTDIFGIHTQTDTDPINLVISDADVMMEIDKKINENKSFVSELDIKNKYNGHTTCLLRTDIIQDSEKHPLGIMYMATDIAERKKAERMKNEFISTVSHELRTPLTSIRGSLGLIRGGVTGELSSQTLKLVDIAYTNSERLVRLINDILDIEKIEAGKMEFHIQRMELLPLVEKSIEMLRNFASQYNVNIKLKNSTHNIESYIDPDRFEQVLVNLISNAAKFSPSGSTVDVDMRMTSDSIVRISVIDQGIGIPDSFKSMLFKKFAQVDSSDSKAKGGTGLGLSISKAIIDKMGGKIDCDSVENAGSTFYFEIPAIQRENDFEDGSINTDTPRILIVEDDADIAALIKMILEDAGYRTAIAYNAEEAKIKLLSNNYAAMTLDLLLPDKQGIQLVRELRENEVTNNLPIIVVSAVADQQKQQLGGGFDIIDWIQKPIDLVRLKRVLHQIIYPVGSEKHSILHVEDDYDNTVIVSQILNDKANIIQAHSLREAKEKIKNEQFELVILDMTLPDGNGMELLPYLKSCGKQSIPVLVFSASETSDNIDKKVAATLVKSKTSNDELVDMIQSILGH